MRRLVVAAAIIFTVAGASARAAYDPHLDVRVDPAAPGAAASLTATVTQAPGEAATQTERVRFPAAFTFNPDLRVARCAPPDERAARCPEASRIGTAAASTMFGDFAGGVFLTGDFRFVVFLRGLAGLVEQEVSGFMVLQGDGSVDSVLDGLPDVQATSASVSFESGPRSLFRTPRACGAYVLDATFVSHAGDQVDRKAAVRIAGCDTAPRIEQAALRRGRLSWRLGEAGAATMVEVDRVVRDGRFDRLRRVMRLRAPAAAGANHVTLDLSRRRPGRYQVLLTTLSARGRVVDVRRLALVVT